MKNKNTQLIYYLISKLQNHTNFSRSLLQQLVIVIDHISYIKAGKRISQFEKFMTFSWGIVPKPMEFFAIIEYLQQNSKIKFYNAQNGGKTYGRYSITDEFDVDIITEEEKLLIDEIIVDSREWTSRSVNDFYMSSSVVARLINPEGWSLAFENTLLTLDVANESDINWGRYKIK